MELFHVPAWAQADPEWRAPLHLLTGRALRGKGCLRAVDFERREIDFPGLAEQARPWSHSERILLCAAWYLFNGGDRAAVAGLLDRKLLAEVVSTLDTGNMMRLLGAVRLRRRDMADLTAVTAQCGYGSGAGEGVRLGVAPRGPRG